VDPRTGQARQLPPVEDRTGTPVAPTAQTQAAGPVAPGVDVGNMTQEQLNQALSQNNPYLTASEPTQVAGPYTPAQEAQYKQLVEQGKSPAEATDIVESGQDTGPAVPVSITGAAGTAEAPTYAVADQMTPGSQLATQTEIDSGQATYNSAANAWEVAPAPAPQTPAAISLPVAETPGAVAPASVETTTPVTTAPVATAPTTTTPVAPVDSTPVATLPEVVITAPRLPVAPPVYVPPLAPVQTANLTPSQPIPEVQANTTPATDTTTTAPVEPTTPVYPPVYVPPVVPKVEMPTYGPLAPTQWGQVGTVNLPGTNPGFFTNVPAQYAPQGVRSQFYYGPRALQTGERFSPEQYRNVPNAPVAPWGLQQMYNPQTQTIDNLLRGVGQAATQAPYNRPAAPRV
jgi:hypothetical protein